MRNVFRFEILSFPYFQGTQRHLAHALSLRRAAETGRTAFDDHRAARAGNCGTRGVSRRMLFLPRLQKTDKHHPRRVQAKPRGRKCGAGIGRRTAERVSLAASNRDCFQRAVLAVPNRDCSQRAALAIPNRKTRESSILIASKRKHSGKSILIFQRQKSARGLGRRRFLFSVCFLKYPRGDYIAVSIRLQVTFFLGGI